MKTNRKERHLVEEIIPVVLVGNGNELIKVPRTNGF